MALRPTSDLGSLMQKALEEYNETTKDLKKDADPSMEARSMEDVEKYVTSHVDRFQKFRHPGTKFDVLRTAIGNNLGQIQGMSNVLAGPTTAAFPAAAPIFTAINFLVFTGNRVKADFDNLMDFLEEVGTCMNSISIVEGFIHTGRQIPQLDADFKAVFGAVLTLCGISTRYMKDGRLQRGFLRGLFGDDRGLSVAYVKLQKAMASLGRSIANGSYAGIVEITAGMAALQDQVRALEVLAKDTSRDVKDVKDAVKEIRDDLKDQNMPNTRRIREFFVGFAPWKEAFEEKKRRFVAGTADWLLQEDDVYTIWYAKGDKTSWGRGVLSFLWVWGPTGTGKSMLAYKAVDSLSIYAAEFRGVSVAYFFFPPENKISLKTVLHSLIVQVADYDELYCKRIADVIKDLSQNKPASIDTVSTFKKFLADQFPSGSARGNLYLVLDGIEELKPDDQKGLQEIIALIVSEKLNIKLLLFGQSELNDKFARAEDHQAPHVEVTTERIDDAIKLFIHHRVSKFEFEIEDDLKTEIVDTLSQNRGGFAFVNASLQEIEASGEQPEDIPDVLKALPTEYKDLLKRVVDRTLRNLQASKAKNDRLEAVKILLYWNARAKKYLTIKELRCILAMKTKYKTYNVVTEVKKACAGLLWLETDGDEDEAEPSYESQAGEQGTVETRSAIKPVHRNENEIYADCLVKFRESRFEDCFSDLEWTTEVNNPLIENAHTVNLELALDAMRILTYPSSDPQYALTRDLEEWATKWWDDQLDEVDIDKVTDIEVSKIIKAVKQVFTAPETTSVALEKQDAKMYDYFISAKMPNPDKPDEEKGLVMRWALRAQSIGYEKLHLSPSEAEWLESFIASPPSLLKSLGEEHVRHWFHESDITTAQKKFDFALSAYTATGAIIKDEKIWGVSETDIIKISEKCADEMGEDAYRAIGATMSWYDFDKKAVDYFTKALEQSKSGFSKFNTLVALGRSHLKAGQPTEAEERLNEAIKMQVDMLAEATSKSSTDYMRKLLRMAYKQLGRCLALKFTSSKPPNEDDAKKAIHGFEQAITFAAEDDSTSANVALMDQIYRLLVAVNNPKDIVDTVCSWETKLRAAWMLADVEYEANQQIYYQQASKAEDRVDDMTKCYKDAMEAISDTGDKLLMQVAIASMHWKVLGDEDLAHEELQQIMETDNTLWSGKQARHRASILLSEIMYSRIKLAPTVWMRRILASNLADISQKDTESGLDIWNIRPNISLASAYLRSNQRSKAVQLLDSTFLLCMEWLTDDVSWNDSQSLRLLARLLACVGLYKDAEIACSATFSVLDKTDPEPDLDNEAEKEVEGELENTDGAGSASNSEEHTTSVINSLPTNADNQEQQKSQGDDSAEGRQATFNQLNRLIPIYEEETYSTSSWCNNCRKTFTFWVKGEPLYMCIICQGMDLCKDCHAKRIAIPLGAEISPSVDGVAGQAEKVDYCGEHHDYVKAPTEGWGGVRYGIMSVVPEKVEFRHWLKDVEERWGLWKEGRDGNAKTHEHV